MGFDISEAYVAQARDRLPTARSTVKVADFFEIPWDHVINRVPDPLLILGNPPWVTNSALGAIEGQNLPAKSNFKQQHGLDALTGKSNFDISEWIILRLLSAVHHRPFALAMLCKASVARRVMSYVAAREWSMTGEVRVINAHTHFAADVNAVMLHVTGTGDARFAASVQWPVYSSLAIETPSTVMGVVEGRTFSDIHGYESTRYLEGPSQIEWRSGIKHDCARVMELKVTDGHLTNGIGETVDVEPEHVFPLLKGSDLANGRLSSPRAVIVTQRRLGEDTRTLRTQAPRLWKYLDQHRECFEARKSSVYRGQPPFAVFGVGAYSFAPFKVSICGLYKRLRFTLVRPIEGRPVMVDDTAYFLPCTTENESESLAAALNSPAAHAFFQARVFWDAKRPIAKALLKSLSLERLLGACG